MADNKKATFLLEFKEKGIKIIEQTVAQLEELGIDSEEASKKIDDLANSMKDLANDSKKSAKSVDSVADDIEQVGDESVKSESRIRSFFRSLSSGARTAGNATSDTTSRLTTLLKVAASYIAIQKTLDYTRNLATELDKVAVMADRAGVAFEKFNAYNTVAKRFDINVEVLSDKFVDINELVSEAANFGSGSLVEVLGVLNLNAKELVKLKPDEQVMALIKAMKGLDPNYQRQLIAAFNADDLIPLFNNLDLVEKIQGRINRAGLNIDPKGVQNMITNFDVLKNDVDSFTKVTLTTLTEELDKMYGLNPEDDSLLNAQTARDIGVILANLVKVVELLGKSFLFVAESVDLVITALLSIPSLLRSGMENAGKFLDDLSDDRKQRVFDTYKELYADDPKNLQIVLEAEAKFLKSRSENNEKFAERQTTLYKNLGTVLKKEYGDIGDVAESVARSSDFSSFKKPLVLEDIDNTAITAPERVKTDAEKTLDIINSLKADLVKINKDIEAVNIDIQITPEKTPELNKKLQGFIKEKNNILDKLVNKYKATTVSIIDVKNGELELKQSKDALTQYYKDVESKNKEAFDKQVKIFNDQVLNVNLSVELGITERPAAIKQLEEIYKNFEAYLKSNGTLNELLNVQNQKQQTINNLKKESLTIENLNLQILKQQGKEVEANEISRKRAISDIKSNVKDLTEQAEAINLTEKIFDFTKLEATLSQASKEIDKLQAKYENTDFFNTAERLKLEEQITVQKKIQEDTQKKLGIETQKANAEAILTVKQVKQLDTILEDSLLDNFSDFIAGTKSAGEAFNDFATTFLKNISKMILQQLYLSALQQFGGGQSTGGIASMVFGSLPTFHTGIGANSTSSFQPTVQIPGVTKDNEGLAVLKKGEKVVTQNQQYNQDIRNSTSTSNNTFYMDNEQVSKAALDNSFGEEYVLKIITKNRSTIKNL